MKKITFILSFVLLAFHFSGCSNFRQQETDIPTVQHGNPDTEIITQEDIAEENLEKSVSSTQKQQNTGQRESEHQELSENGEEDHIVENIEIVIGDTVYTVKLYDNEAAQTLAAQLPLTLDMNELNGNEKYYYLADRLPVNSGVPDGINTGDLMLYGSDCLVLFYKSFSTSYSYTPLGRVDNTDGLAQTLGSGGVQITFQKSN